MRIRVEQPGDASRVRALNDEAFEGTLEGELIEALRAGDHVVVSLVTIEDGSDAVVGHILFSELPIATANGELRGAALGPMAVAKAHQRGGIGSALVRQGVEAVRDLGYEVIVVLGHPDYYPRFGFSAQAARGIASPYSTPYGEGEPAPPGSEAFMALDLREGADGPIIGTAHYAPPFAALPE